MKPTVESPYGNYCSPLFEHGTLRYRAQGIAKSNKHRQSGYTLMHMGEDEQTGDGFSAQKNPMVRAGFEPGASRSPVMSYL